MSIKYKRYKVKGKLPEVIKPKKLSGELRQRLYEEEVFDCIKASIRPKDEPVVKSQPVFVPPKTYKQRERDIRAWILSIYTETGLASFDKKKKRRAERHKFTQAEYQVFCGMCKEYGRYVKKTLKRNRKRRRHEKKGAKHSKYETYINSRAWQSRRNDFWKTHKRRCSVCDTASHIHLHHMDYERLGNEPDEHLVALCKKHHDMYHSENGVQRHMIRKTTDFIERERAVIASVLQGTS